MEDRLRTTVTHKINTNTEIIKLAVAAWGKQATMPEIMDVAETLAK